MTHNKALVVSISVEFYILPEEQQKDYTRIFTNIKKK